MTMMTRTMMNSSRTRKILAKKTFGLWADVCLPAWCASGCRSLAARLPVTIVSPSGYRAATRARPSMEVAAVTMAAGGGSLELLSANFRIFAARFADRPQAVISRDDTFFGSVPADLRTTKLARGTATTTSQSRRSTTCAGCSRASYRGGARRFIQRAMDKHSAPGAIANQDF